MAFKWNTSQLLAAAQDNVGDRTPIEYHFQSWRELYDKSIITADRHSSSAGEWVLRGDSHFYTLKVITRPTYALPQELCLSFDCFSRNNVKELSEGSSFISSGPPVEQVASQFATLLSTFVREPIIPLGPRRIGNRPVADRPYYTPPPRSRRLPPPPPAALYSNEFEAILKGIPEASEPTFESALAAMNFYRAALLLVSFDPAGAYVSLVSAIECLAGYHYKDRDFPFDTVHKFQRLQPILDQLGNSSDRALIVEQLRQELVRSEHFVFQKFKLFVTEHLPEQFWTITDTLYPHDSGFPTIKKENLAWCLRQVYEARSDYLHGGKSYPRYIDFGVQPTCLPDILEDLLDIKTSERCFPFFSWFERLTQTVIVEYVQRAFAPQLVQAKKVEQEERQRMLSVIRSLSEDARKDLLTLTEWTARFIGLSVINPMAPNREWTNDPKNISALMQAGLIGSKGNGPDGSSWLKNRDVGEVVGEFFFGLDKNPFRGNELLLTKNWEDLRDS